MNHVGHVILVVGQHSAVADHVMPVAGHVTLVAGQHSAAVTFDLVALQGWQDGVVHAEIEIYTKIA